MPHHKIVVLASVVVLAAGLGACFKVKSNVERTPDKVAGTAAFKLVVTAAQTKDGEKLTFAKGNRATVKDGNLLVPELASGPAVVTSASSLPAAQILSLDQDRRGRITGLTTNDGRYYKVLKAEKTEEGVRLVSAVPYRLKPLSDFDLVWVRKTNGPATALVSLLSLAAVGGLVVLALPDDFMQWDYSHAFDNAESCPFVYAFDGEKYVLEAEPYGGSVCAGLERADWSVLDSLKPVAGRYRLLLSNELDEVEHVDELKLVVVDHPAGVTVSPEVSGRMRTLAAPVPPSAARDGDGRDVRAELAAADGRYWLGRIEGRDPDRDEDLKDELVLEFPRPAGARQAKLLAEVRTTMWGSQAIRPLLASQGRELPAYFDKIDAGGPALLSLLGWFAREEMYNLQVRVETASGWKVKALVYGGGPIIAKDKAYGLDLSDIAGDTVRIRLTPAAGFWMIDRLALDFSDDVPVRVTEVAAEAARDGSGRDAGLELAADDALRLVLPKGSRPAALEFPVPPETPGAVRTVFVKARGYYDILLDAGGEPTLDLEAMMAAPGASLRFVLRQHPVLVKPGPRGAEARS